MYNKLFNLLIQNAKKKQQEVQLEEQKGKLRAGEKVQGEGDLQMGVPDMPQSKR